MKLLLMQLPTNQSRHTEFMTMFMYDLIYDVAYFGKFSNFGKEKDFIKGKKYSFNDNKFWPNSQSFF